MKKIIYTSNWDWVLYNFRLSLAKSAREAGYRVAFVCPDGKYIEDLQARGFRWIPWTLDRRSLNPLTEARSVWRLAKIYEREQPDLIHHDTIKPNLYGALATWLNTTMNRWDARPQIVNSFMGIGFLFSDRPLARFLRPLVEPVMRFAMQREGLHTTFSNREDYKTLVDKGIVDSSRAQVMVSEFVDVNRFAPSSDLNRQDTEQESTVGQDTEADSSSRQTSEGEPIRVLMAARLLWDKGVKEFIKAAQILEDRYTRVEFVLAGEPDVDAQGYVPIDQLEAWNDSGTIQWLGYCSDMPSLLRSVDVAVLPTHYNEGLPRFLVEAAASGLPLVATDLPACRRVVDHEQNGQVIPTKNPQRLADAIQHLAENPSRRRRMGRASREKAVTHFSKDKSVGEWLALYNRLAEQSKTPRSALKSKSGSMARER